MPLKLNVGLSRKIGLPAYSSLGASCHVEVELDPSLISSDLEAFHRHVRNAFVACREAVLEELSRHQPMNSRDYNGVPAAGHNGTNGRRAAARDQPMPTPAMTRAQRRAIDAIAQRIGMSAEDECQRVLGLALDQLTIRSASSFIDYLKSVEHPPWRDDISP